MAPSQSMDSPLRERFQGLDEKQVFALLDSFDEVDQQEFRAFMERTSELGRSQFVHYLGLQSGVDVWAMREWVF